MYKFHKNLTLATVICLIVLLGFATVQAQPITIGSNDMPARNQSYRISIGDSLLQIDPSITGANQTWDFSSLNAIIQRKDTFISANDVPLTIRIFLPLTLTFPTDRSLVQFINTPDSLAGFALGDVYQIYEVRSNSMRGHGFGSELQSFPLTLLNDPTDTVYRFPLNYADVDSGASVAEFEVPGIVYIRQQRKRINEVDGWGTITTPYGTFDALRIKTIITGVDSISLDTLGGLSTVIPQTIEYKWLAQGIGVPVLKIEERAGIISSIEYRDSARSVPVVSIDQTNFLREVSIAPNPASKQFQLFWKQQLGSEGQLEIRDLQGRLVKRMDLLPASQSSMRIDVRGIAAGTYLVRLLSSRGVFSGKLVIDR